MYAKELTDVQLHNIFGGVSFQTKPFRHQLVSLAFAGTHPRCALVLDVGLGKTWVALHAFMLNGCKRGLAVCPSSVITTWEEEAQKHTDLRIQLLTGTAEEREEKLREPADLYVLNYEGLQVLFAEPEVKVNAKLKKKPNKVAIKNGGFDMFIADEFHHLKSPTTLVTKIAHDLSVKASRVVFLSGTPVSIDESDLWAEYWVLDQGESLGPSWWHFMNMYFWKNRWKWEIHRRCQVCGKVYVNKTSHIQVLHGMSLAQYRGRFGYRKDPSVADEILRRIAPATLRYERAECFDLPPKTYVVRKADPTAEQLQLMEGIREGFAIIFKTADSLKPAVADGINKLIQVAGGFAITDQGPKRLTLNPKLDALEEVIADTHEKAIIFHHFVEEGRMIEDLCRRMGRVFRSARGEIPDRQQKEGINAFRHDPDVEFLIANPQSVGEGLNFQMARVVIFYSRGYTAKEREQCEGRIWARSWATGKETPAIFIDILLHRTIDEEVYRLQQGRKDMVTGLLAYLKRGR